jgi:GNAT superfamily N-acetyltransferase
MVPPVVKIVICMRHCPTVESAAPLLPPGFTLRRAALSEVAALRELIAASARGLSAADYTPAQIEGALRGAFGVDTQLIRDGSYYVVEHESRLLACGGWSRRRTLFGSDARADRDDAALDPARDAARIRAFFIHPGCTRRGLASALLQRCELDAAAQGFARFELMATLPGVRFYAARGYVAGEPFEWPLTEQLGITFVPMRRELRRSEACRSLSSP